jgi:hypothetical protein
MSSATTGATAAMAIAALPRFELLVDSAAEPSVATSSTSPAMRAQIHGPLRVCVRRPMPAAISRTPKTRSSAVLFIPSAFASGFAARISVSPSAMLNHPSPFATWRVFMS